MFTKPSFIHKSEPTTKKQCRSTMNHPCFISPDSEVLMKSIPSSLDNIIETTTHSLSETSDGKKMKTIKTTFFPPHSRHHMGYSRPTRIQNSDGGYTQIEFEYTPDGRCASRIVTIVSF